MRTAEEVQKVLALSARGHNNCAISRLTGIPRSTVSYWVRGTTPKFGIDRSRGGICARCGDLRHPAPCLVIYAYAYLLGLYLGDGCLLRHPRRVYRLHITLDAGHPLIVAECAAAMSLVMPSSKAIAMRHPRWKMFNVVSYSQHWPHLFPQHGAGRKHNRRIELDPWQELVVERYPGRLLRGLIQSDGCRVNNKIRHPKKTYEYPRYFFTNRSQDIQRIFCEACDRLGIAWRQHGPWNISVARREAVAIMDRHVGPKR
jgi:hypothetical protein